MKNKEKTYRVQVVLAAAWRIVSELMRRHCDKYRLRVMDLKRKGEPESLGLFQDAGSFPGTPLCRLELAGDGSIWIGAKSKVVSRIDGYVGEFLASEDPAYLARRIESALDLPEYKGRFLPATTPPVLVYRLLSGLLERFAMSKEELRPRCGWIEMGGEGSHAMEELMLFPEISQGIGAEISTGGNRALASSKYWLLFVRPAPDKAARLAALFDLDGVVIHPGKPPVREDAVALYEKTGREILPMIDALEADFRR